MLLRQVLMMAMTTMAGMELMASGRDGEQGLFEISENGGI
jgi:hypothetical protein